MDPSSTSDILIIMVIDVVPIPLFRRNNSDWPPRSMQDPACKSQVTCAANFIVRGFVI